MKITKKKMDELHKTEKNIRKHSERQIKEYIRSLEMFGQIRPLVVTEDGEILVGNGMYEALTQMGKTECDVYVVEGLTKVQKRKLMLADNKVYDLGVNDTSILDDILGDLGGDFDVPGYNADLLSTIFSTTEDESADVIADYGAHGFDVSDKKNEDKTVSYKEVEQTQYAPPAKTLDGEFVPPVEKNKDEGKTKYIICPHCGEKIWL